jgi:hypothetical protein
MTTYSEKLKDPRWQRRRLHMLEAAGWKCSGCQAEDKTLHVHHKLYRKGADPWEYSDDELAVLCEGCHGRDHAARDLLDSVLVNLTGYELLKVGGYAFAQYGLPNRNRDSEDVDPWLLGIAQATAEPDSE